MTDDAGAKSEPMDSDALLRAVARVPSHPPVTAATLAPGDVVAGRYRLDRLLGEGGMGVVWAADHVVTRKPVALKLLKSTGGEGAGTTRQRFLREARAACAVRHPSVVQVHDVLELEDGSPVMVMDLLRGETLGAKLKRDGTMTLPAVARVLVPVCAAVGAAHALGIVHRDLKPENIFLADEQDGTTSVKVLDFGIAKLTATEGLAARSGTATGTGALVGTPHYMSPEQMFGEKNVDHRTDLWAVGIILYEALTGERPTGDNLGSILKAVAKDGMVPLRERAPSLPEPVLALVSGLLEHEPARRPADMHAVIEVLSAYTDAVAQPFGRARSRARRLWVPIVAVGAAAVAATALVVSLEGRREKRVVASTASSARGPVRYTQRLLTEDPRRPPETMKGDPSLTLDRDGSRVAYLCGFAICVRPVAGGAETRLPVDAKTITDALGFEFLSRDTLVVVAPDAAAEETRTWIVPIDGRPPQKVRTDATKAVGFDASPDGRHLALVGPYRRTLDVVPMDEDGPPRRIVVAGQNEMIDSVGWSPRSDAVAYVRRFRGGEAARLEIASTEVLRTVGVLPAGTDLFSPSYRVSVLWAEPDRLLAVRYAEASPHLVEVPLLASGEAAQPLRDLFTWPDGEIALAGVVNDRVIYTQQRTTHAVRIARLGASGDTLEGGPTEAYAGEREPIPVGWLSRGRLAIAYLRSGDLSLGLWGPGGLEPQPLLEGVRTAQVLPRDDLFFLRRDAGVCHAYAGVASDRAESLGNDPWPCDTRMRCTGDRCVEISARGEVSEVRRWDARERRFIGEPCRLPTARLEAAVSPDGALVAAIDRAGTADGACNVQVLDAKTCAALRTYEIARDIPAGATAQSIAFARDGKRVFVSVLAVTPRILSLSLPAGVESTLVQGRRDSWLYAPRPSDDGRYLAYHERRYSDALYALEPEAGP